MKLDTPSKLITATLFFSCLGIPFAAQAGTNHDTGDYDTPRHYDSRGISHSNQYDRRNQENRRLYTDQYGDLDTTQQRRNTRRYRGDESIRSHSASSSRDSRFRNTVRKSSDETLRNDILDELEDGTDRVNVSVANGVVTLSGMVANRESMIEVIEQAYDAGATKVRNEMEVFRYEDRPWADLSDRALTRAVRKELSWSPFVDEDPIRVTAKKGVVTLRGTVEDSNEMAAAIENAYEAGARIVKNRLQVAN